MVQPDAILTLDQRVRVFTVSYRNFATPSGPERLLADDPAVL